MNPSPVLVAVQVEGPHATDEKVLPAVAIVVGRLRAPRSDLFRQPKPIRIAEHRPSAIDVEAVRRGNPVLTWVEVPDE